MIKLNVLRVVSWGLSLVILVFAWYHATAFVNELLDIAESIARACAQWLARALNADPTFVEMILLERVHMDRTIVISSIMILVFFVLLEVSRQKVGYHVSRVFLMVILAHLVLTLLWVLYPKEASAWYAMHYEWVRSWLRSFGWHKSETLVLRLMKVHTILVFAELVLILTLPFVAMRRRGYWHRH